MKFRKIRNSSLLGAFLSILIYNDSPTEPVYLFILLAVVLAFVYRKQFNDPFGSQVFYICCVVSSTYFLALMVGLLNGSNLQDAIRNNFGLLIYPFCVYLIFRIRPTDEQFGRFFKAFLFIQLGYAFYYTLPLFDGRYAFELNAQLSERKLAYSTGFIIFLSYLFVSIFEYSKGLPNSQSYYSFRPFGSVILGILVLVFFSIFPNLSKGYFLALAVVFLSFLAVTLLKKRRSFSENIVVFTVMAGCFFLIYKYLPVLMDMFSGKDASNAYRSIQFSYLAEDLQLFGKGNGAALAGFDRGHYGIELSYLGLIHKMGLLSLPYFFLLALPFALYLRKLTVLGCSGREHFGISLMLYVIPAMGNPLLLSPLSVMAHAGSIYMLSRGRNK